MLVHHAYDWGRKTFVRSYEGEEGLTAAQAWVGSISHAVLQSAGGPGDALLLVRVQRRRPSDRRVRIWHGDQAVAEESMRGWFGPTFQRLGGRSLSPLVDRIGAAAIINVASNPCLVVARRALARAGANARALETLTGLPVMVATGGLHTPVGHVPSLRVYVDYDGTRYARGSRKLFADESGQRVSVESLARGALSELGFDAAHPALFHRLFRTATGFPVSQWKRDAWVQAFAAHPNGPLGALGAAHEAIHRMADAPSIPEEAIPRLARYLPASKVASWWSTTGSLRIAHVLQGLLLGYEATAADWFTWEREGARAAFCEVKSRGDRLRDSQKEAILWCERVRGLEYRLLEVLH